MVDAGPLAILGGGAVVFFKRGLKLALAGAIGMVTVTVFTLFLSIGLFTIPELVAALVIIYLALLYCPIAGIICCDLLLVVKREICIKYSLNCQHRLCDMTIKKISEAHGKSI